MDRDSLQGLAVHRLAKSHRLICQWATGTGKSMVALKFIAANPWLETLILVPEQNNIENWKEEFRKFDVPLDRVTIACYASFHKYQNTEWNFVVFDEAPHIDTDKRRSICESVKGDYILALGAMIDGEELFALESNYGHFEKSEVSLKQAIEWGILPEPTVFVLHCTIDDTKKDHFYKGKLYTAKELYKELDLMVEGAVNTYNASPNERTKRKMLQTGIVRKRFLGKLKDEAVARLAAALQRKNRRFLCFCASIKQAEALGKENAFTSKSPTSMRHLERFNNHEIDSLFVVGKLIEGQNLVDIECGIIGQLGGTSRITIQELGRIMRSKNPKVYIPIFDGTKDESFLYTLTSNIPAEYIQHYKF